MLSSMNIPEAFQEAARKNPKFIPLEMEGRKYSYEEILSLSKSIASFLFKKGVKKRDRVAILLEGRPEWGIVYLGISFLGAAAVPIDIQLSSKEVRNLLEDSDSKVIFVSEKTTKTNETATDAVNIDSDIFSEIMKHPHMDSFPSIDPEVGIERNNQARINRPQIEAHCPIRNLSSGGKLRISRTYSGH